MTCAPKMMLRGAKEEQMFSRALEMKDWVHETHGDEIVSFQLYACVTKTGIIHKFFAIPLEMQAVYSW